MPKVALRALLVAVLGCFLGFTRAAQGSPLPVDLSWDAPEECPSHDEVMTELARITRVKDGRLLTPISAQAKIERGSDGRYHLRLRTQRDDQTGDTDLDAASCPVLKRGVTLVLALALGDGVDLIDEKSAPPPAEQAPKAVPPPLPKPKPKPNAPPLAKAPSASLLWEPWLAASGTSGLSARPALAPELGLAVGQRHWLMTARVSYLPPASAPSLQDIDSSFSAFVAGLGACGRLPAGAWSFAGCAVFEAAAVHGSSQGAFQDSTATAPWYAVGPELVMLAPLAGPLKLRAAVGLAVSLDPPHFAIRGLREVYVVSRVVPTVSLGCSL